MSQDTCVYRTHCSMDARRERTTGMHHLIHWGRKASAGEWVILCKSALLIYTTLDFISSLFSMVFQWYLAWMFWPCHSWASEYSEESMVGSELNGKLSYLENKAHLRLLIRKLRSCSSAAFSCSEILPPTDNLSDLECYFINKDSFPFFTLWRLSKSHNGVARNFFIHRNCYPSLFLPLFQAVIHFYGHFF